MRILVVSGLSSDSGCMLRARYLASSLRKAGAEVRLAKAIRALPFWLDWLVSALWNLRFAFWSCDVVIGCKPLPGIIPLLLLKKLCGTLTVLDIDDLDFAYRGGPGGAILRLFQTPFPKRFDIVTYHNQTLAPAIQELFGVPAARLVRLRQGVDFDVFSPNPSTVRPALDTSAHWVAYPGHLNIASDLDAVFEVIRIARKTHPSVRLLVVGGGPGEGKFRAMAKARGVGDITKFTGYVTPDTVALYCKACHAGIAYYKDQPANWYRESMKVREMLAMGMRVVTTSVGELKQFSSLTYQGQAVPEEIAGILLSVLQAGGDGREAAGPPFVRRHMDWAWIGSEFYLSLNAALESRKICNSQAPV
jgi:glycosyltransferase involved in cell wall biosynthesis